MSTHRLDVQGMRAVAVSSVLLFHFYPKQFPNGFLGVDVFFIISGYLIFTIFSRSIKKNGLNCSSIFDFYYRRLARIVPLSLVYVCCAVIAYCYMANSILIKQSQVSAWGALLYVTNILAVAEKENYFEKLLDENLFTHTWSLAVEVQYYLILPILVFINSFFGNGKTILFYIVVSIGSLAMYFYAPYGFSFNMMFTRLWQFLLITLFSSKIRQREEETELGKANLLVLDNETTLQATAKTDTISLILYYSSFALLWVPIFPFALPHSASRIVISIASVLIIVYGDKIENLVLSNRLSVFVGDISYSLYLFHWPFSVYLHRPFNPIDINFGIPLSLATTIVVYHVFEKRYRKWTKNVVIIFSLIFTILAAIMIQGSPVINDAMQKQTTMFKEAAIKENENMFWNKIAHLHIQGCDWENKYKKLIDPPLGLCKLPKGNGKLKFMLVGNSYSSNQGTEVYEAFKPFFSEFSIFNMPDCEVLSYTTSTPYCKHEAEFKDVIPELKPDVIFIIQKFFAAAKQPIPPPTQRDKVYEEMEQRLDLVYNMSSLFFIADAFPSSERDKVMNSSQLIRAGKTAAQINEPARFRKCPETFFKEAAINHYEDANARPRTAKLMKYCGEKCHLYDIKPAIVDRRGKVMAVDEETWLWIYDQDSHFSTFGKKKIAPIYMQLAEKYAEELRTLEKKLYPSNN